MSTAGSLPYHLRPNKAIERAVFIETLTRFHAYFPIQRHTYVGLGGPFLEDFRLVHAAFGLRRMISLEVDPDVRERQLANRPNSVIECRLQTTDEFITSYDLESNAIIWLDYSDGAEHLEQFGEIQALLPRLRAGDILKVTLNAAPDVLGGRKGAPAEELWSARLEELKNRIGDFLPSGTTADQMRPREYGRVLLSSLVRACRQAMEGSREETLELMTAFVYADGQQMLTLTMAIIPRNAHSEFRQRTGLGSWHLRYRDESAPLRIDVPELSTRERLLVDKWLPRHGAAALLGKLKYNCSRDKKLSIEQLNSYRLFYRHFPYFSRIVP